MASTTLRHFVVTGLSIPQCLCLLGLLQLFNSSPSFAVGPVDFNEQQREAWENSPKKRSELDPETRQRFDELRAELTKAEKEYHATKQAALENDQLRVLALELKDKANREEQQLKPTQKKVRNHFKSLSQENRQAQYRLQRAWSKIKFYTVFKQLADDPKLRPLAIYFAQQVVSDYQSDPRNGNPGYERIKDLVPAGDEELTAEQSLETYLAILKRTHDYWDTEFDQVSQSHQLPAFVLDHIDDETRMRFTFQLGDVYARLTKPASIELANKKLSKLHKQLSEIWPRWRWAEAPEELRNPPDRATGNFTSGKNRGLLWLVIGNAILLLLWTGISYARKHRRKNNDSVKQV